jgi:hypothetical protein
MAGQRAELQSRDSGLSVYKMSDQDVWTGAVMQTKLFHFNASGKLKKVTVVHEDHFGVASGY